VKAVNSGYTVAQVKQAILSGVDVKSGLSGKCVTGGRVNAGNALSSSQINNAQIISHTIPSTMTAGQSYSVSVTMKNTGTTTWSEGSMIRLGDASSDSEKFGSPGRFYLPAGTTVAPNDQYTFSFVMTAPSTPGSYTPKYMMVWEFHEWFGPLVSANVQVTSSVKAELLSHTIPSTMNAGQSYSVSVTMKNTGTTTWSEGSMIRLGDGSSDSEKFGSPGRYYLPAGTTVAPNDQYTFSFVMTAPSTPGSYTPKYMMVWEFHEWFGPLVSANVQVLPSSVKAELSSHTIPSTMAAGQSYSVSVTMKNTGTTTWSEGSMIRLGDASSDSEKFGSPGRFYLPAGTTVAPNDQYTFSFVMTAPSTPGSYTPKYMMVWEFHEWFGELITIPIKVNL
jgi:uncharacterized protein affecting Mg2+/Co2+ transport